MTVTGYQINNQANMCFNPHKVNKQLSGLLSYSIVYQFIKVDCDQVK
jgi:nitrate reductase cytochrome c-type subunit